MNNQPFKLFVFSLIFLITYFVMSVLCSLSKYAAFFPQPFIYIVFIVLFTTQCHLTAINIGRIVIVSILVFTGDIGISLLQDNILRRMILNLYFIFLFLKLIWAGFCFYWLFRKDNKKNNIQLPNTTLINTILISYFTLSILSIFITYESKGNMFYSYPHEDFEIGLMCALIVFLIPNYVFTYIYLKPLNIKNYAIKTLLAYYLYMFFYSLILVIIYFSADFIQSTIKYLESLYVVFPLIIACLFVFIITSRSTFYKISMYIFLSIFLPVMLLYTTLPTTKIPDVLKAISFISSILFYLCSFYFINYLLNLMSIKLTFKNKHNKEIIEPYE